MVSASFSFTTSEYRVPALALHGQSYQIQVDFEDGSHVFTSPDFELGIVHSLGGRTLLGRLSFRYSYDSTARVITVCGTDYASADGMKLATTPQGTDQVCFEHASSSGFAADESYSNGLWNYNVQLMPGATQIFKNIARDANEALISALETLPELIIQVRKTLPRLPMDHYLDLCVVYRNGRFLEFYNPANEYGPDDHVSPIESKFGGIVTMTQGENFANVIGSTSDPKIGGLSWIRLWAGEIGFYPTLCTSLNYNGFRCDDNLKGGHVISGRTARIVAQGSNSVWIYPICTNHNNNDNVYMAALAYRRGVWLVDYLE